MASAVRPHQITKTQPMRHTAHAYIATYKNPYLGDIPVGKHFGVIENAYTQYGMDKITARGEVVQVRLDDYKYKGLISKLYPFSTELRLILDLFNSLGVRTVKGRECHQFIDIVKSAPPLYAPVEVAICEADGERYVGAIRRRPKLPRKNRLNTTNRLLKKVPMK